MITRRGVLFAVGGSVLARGTSRVAVTMDDVRWQAIPDARRAEAERALLEHVRGAKAMLFAVGENVANPEGAAILERWSAAGHWIGNHTYSHQWLAGGKVQDFEQDILRNEDVLRNCAGFRKWFRFPALKEGSTAEVRDELRGFLKAHGYRNGAVTIDTSDWYYSQRLVQKLKEDPSFDAGRYRKPYLDHLWDRAQFYDQLAREVLGRSIPHTILLHYNLVNALFLDDALEMLKAKGWGVVGVDEAYDDPVFKRNPANVPAGESLVWALAKETGHFEQRLRYPGEDDRYEKAALDRAGL